VVTGQGNIHVSLVHSQKVTKHLVENYLRADDDDPGLDARPSFAPAEARAAGQARAVEETLRGLPALSDAAMAAVERRVRERQKRVGYTGDYDSWIARVTPPDLE